MKKIISLVFVIVMLFACTVPAFAETFIEPTNIVEDAVYKVFIIKADVEVSIDCNVKIEDRAALKFADNTTLIITENGSLTGKNLVILNGTNNKIELNGGFINLTFSGEINANKFEQILQDSNIAYIRIENHIVAGCSHSEWENNVCTRCGIYCTHKEYDNGVCTTCGYVCVNPFHSDVCPDCGMVNTMATGSILSHGYPEIVYGIGGIAIGVVVTLLISRKKKVAVSSTAADDEE